MHIVGIRDEGTANLAERGKNAVKQGNEERLQHPGSESEIRIDHQHPHIRETRLPLNDGRHAAEAIG